jgi:hypothetical protein
VKAKIKSRDGDFEKVTGVLFVYLKVINHGLGHYVVFRSEELTHVNQVDWVDVAPAQERLLLWKQSLDRVQLNFNESCPLPEEAIWEFVHWFREKETCLLKKTISYGWVEKNAIFINQIYKNFHINTMKELVVLMWKVRLN